MINETREETKVRVEKAINEVKELAGEDDGKLAFFVWDYIAILDLAKEQSAGKKDMTFDVVNNAYCLGLYRGLKEGK